MFVISIQSGYMFKQARFLSAYKSVAGFLAALNWVLVFLAASIAGPALAANGTQDHIGHAVIAPVVPPAPLTGIVDPAQLPEGYESFEQDDSDESNENEHGQAFDCFVQEQHSLVQTAKGITPAVCYLAIQHSARIPLFILHHSWRSHLIF